MAELVHGQVMPMSGALTQTDSNGKTLEFKAANEDDKNNNVWIAEGSDGNTYTVHAQPQVATVSVTKKRDEKLPKINDPYYQRIAANAPREGNAETTEDREKGKFGKAAKREDVQVSTSTSTSTSTAKFDKNK